MIIKQLIPGLRKLMEETASVLGHRLRSWKMLHCRVPVGWLTL